MGEKVNLINLVDKVLVKKEINCLYKFMKETNVCFDLDKITLKNLAITQLKQYLKYSSKKLDFNILSADQIELLVYDLLEDFFDTFYDSISTTYYYKHLLERNLLDVMRYQN